MLTSREQEFAFFLLGLIGIVSTGAMVGAGGGNYWKLAYIGWGDPYRGMLLLITIIALVAFFDLIAFGVIFAGAVIVEQSLRGRV